MIPDYFLQQTDKPLFPDLLWSRPETKHGAGKLAAIGGQANEFIQVAESYAAAEKHGAGIIRVVMPESTRSFTKMLPNIEYAPSNPSGSFAQTALSELIDLGLWSDATLLAGNLGRNSETSLMLEKLITKLSNRIIISPDAQQSIDINPQELLSSQNLVYVNSYEAFQKVGIALKLQTPITSSAGNLEFAQILHELSKAYPALIVILRGNTVWCAHNGTVTNSRPKRTMSAPEITAAISVWTMQNPYKLLEAATSALYTD